MNKSSISKVVGCSASGLRLLSIAPSASMAKHLNASITCFGDAVLTGFGHIRVYAHGLV
jgi:hypothetical protein